MLPWQKEARADIVAACEKMGGVKALAKPESTYQLVAISNEV